MASKNPNADNKKDQEENNEGAVRPSIHIQLIRHAESQNNEVYRDARRIHKGGTPDFDLDGWNAYVDTYRSADPGLSTSGKEQANKLADFLVEDLAGRASTPVRVVTSPMRRTLETIRPTLERLKEAGDWASSSSDGKGGGSPASVIVNAFYHESEGCHIKDEPKPGMNKKEISSLLVPTALDPSDLSFEGFDPNNEDAGWYSHGTGPETRPESEDRAARFYVWLCEHLDQQLAEASHAPDVFDAGVAGSPTLRRTCLCIGHGDFMALLLKRIVAGFGYTHEREGVTHRSAFVHFNTGEIYFAATGIAFLLEQYRNFAYSYPSHTRCSNQKGITDLEYFGAGRFLLMASNQTPHLPHSLRSGGSLKDGWSYLMPDDKFVLDAEVAIAFSDEIEGHLREQADALRRLYGSKDSAADRESIKLEKTTGATEDEAASTASSRGGEVTLVVKRGLQVVGCASFHEETGRISDVVVRPSARGSQVGRTLVDSARAHAKKVGADRLVAEPDTDEARAFFEKLGFESVERQDGDAAGGRRMETKP